MSCCSATARQAVPMSATVMQPIFDREAEQRGMTRRFGTRWIRRRSKMGGCHETSGTRPARTREGFQQHISIQQPLKQALQFFAESGASAPRSVFGYEKTRRLIGGGSRHEPGNVLYAERLNSPAILRTTTISFLTPTFAYAVRSKTEA